jgi:hypothetical protein
VSVTQEHAKPPVDPDGILAGLAEFWADARFGAIGELPTRKLADGPDDQPVPEGTENPYWEIIRQFPLEDRFSFSFRPEPAFYVQRPGRVGPGSILVTRDELCGTFSWSIPSPGDMTWMREVLGGRGVVEVGAGGGYWAWQMRQAGVDVVAYEPKAVAENHYVRREWAEVLRGGHEAAADHAERALFLCWPSYSTSWAAEALACYEGDTVIYCGEGEGGCCADDDFFRLLGERFDEGGSSPAHVSFMGIHCYLTAYTRKT